MSGPYPRSPASCKALFQNPFYRLVVRPVVYTDLLSRYSFIYSFIHPFILSSIHSVIYSFIKSGLFRSNLSCLKIIRIYIIAIIAMIARLFKWKAKITNVSFQKILKKINFLFSLFLTRIQSLVIGVEERHWILIGQKKNGRLWLVGSGWPGFFCFYEYFICISYFFFKIILGFHWISALLYNLWF